MSRCWDIEFMRTCGNAYILDVLCTLPQCKHAYKTSKSDHVLLYKVCWDVLSDGLVSIAPSDIHQMASVELGQ